MINYIAGVLIVLFTLAVILNQIRLMKKGQSGCGGGCSGCSAHVTCNQKLQSNKNKNFEKKT
ncbi:MAG: FeoB-associated Cys-rich membrane protein [Eubacteriaceae bacterium]|jgi:hypothetical protein|nr:FeoB-associated Cys-rich membrane protein [Eubacteriaceae bacterium]